MVVQGTPAEPQQSQSWETDSDAATVKASNVESTSPTSTGNNPRRNLIWNGERSDSDLTQAGDMNIGDTKQASTSAAPVFSGNNPTREIYWNPPRDGSDHTAREQDGLMKADGVTIDSKSKGRLSNTVRNRMDPTKRNTGSAVRPQLKSNIPATPSQAPH